MPTHWTYKEVEQNENLYQGDIIAREPLMGVLKDIHKHFCDRKYLAFIVVTQTCDMVMRNAQQCKTRHIELAVVRALSSLLPELLPELGKLLQPGVFAQESKIEVSQFLHRVLNQNEQAHGLVYLHPDGDVGIGEPAVAMLRISISLRAKEHYALLQQARRGRLETEYRNKLGWLRGNLYSRVDTPDWADQRDGKKKEEEIIRELLEGSGEDSKNIWVQESLYRAAEKKLPNLKDLSRKALEEAIRVHAPPSPLQNALEEIKKTSEKIADDFSTEPNNAFKAKVQDDPCLLPLIRPLLVKVTASIFEKLTATNVAAFLNQTSTDNILRLELVKKINELANNFAVAKSPKSVSGFVKIVEEANIFTDLAITRVCEVAELTLGGQFGQHRATIVSELTTTKPDVCLLSHIRSLIYEAIQTTHAERFAGRLKNNVSFVNTIKK